MEEKGLVKRKSLENIAEAIRTQLGTDEQFTPDNMDEAILRIQASSSEEIFWVEYGTTTSAEIEAAYQAGKMCYCKVNVGQSGQTSIIILPLMYPYGATYHIFSAAYNTILYTAVCNNGNWSRYQKQLIEAPASASDGQFLIYRSQTGWGAETVPSASGVSF